MVGVIEVKGLVNSDSGCLTIARLVSGLVFRLGYKAVVLWGFVLYKLSLSECIYHSSSAMCGAITTQCNEKE